MLVKMKRGLVATSVVAVGFAGLTVSGPAVGVESASAGVAPFRISTVAIASPPKQTFRVNNEKQLRRAVRQANRSTAKDKIVIRGQIKFRKRRRGGAGERVGRGDINITESLVIFGRKGAIDSNNASRVFDISRNTRVVLKRLRLLRGRAPQGESGGAIRNRGTLIIKSSSIRDSDVASRFTPRRTTYTGAGGAIYNQRGHVKIQDSALHGNKASFGGAIATNGGVTVVRKSKLVQNFSDVGGAAGVRGSGRMKLFSSKVDANFADEGGGLWNSPKGVITLQDSEVTENGAGFGDSDNDGDGGGIYNGNGTLKIRSSTVIYNSAGTNGGGIYNVGGAVTYRGGTVSLNTAETYEDGGGDEPVAGEGGGLWNGSGAFTATDLTFGEGDDANRAPFGQDYFNDDGAMSINGSPVAPGTGGR